MHPAMKRLICNVLREPNSSNRRGDRWFQCYLNRSKVPHGACNSTRSRPEAWAKVRICLDRWWHIFLKILPFEVWEILDPARWSCEQAQAHADMNWIMLFGLIAMIISTDLTARRRVSQEFCRWAINSNWIQNEPWLRCQASHNGHFEGWAALGTSKRICIEYTSSLKISYHLKRITEKWSYHRTSGYYMAPCRSVQASAFLYKKPQVRLSLNQCFA